MDTRIDCSNCEISGSELCEWLIVKSGRQNCHIRDLKTEHQKKEALERWRETLSLLPTDIDELHNTDKCVFCKHERYPADGYAFVDMAHAEPYSEKGMILGYGKKVRCEVGSMLSIQAAVCRGCRTKIRFAELLPMLIMILFAVTAVIILITPEVSNIFSSVGELVSVISLIGIIALGYFIGRIFQANYISKLINGVKVDVSEIPVFKKMLDNGWFLFQAEDKIPKFSFSRRKQYRCLKSAQLDNTPAQV